MKNTLFIAALTLCLSCAAASVRSVVTTTGNTRGEIYYTGVNLGAKAYGDTFAGKLPDESATVQQLIADLRADGRMPASREHPATCTISVEWGTMSPGTGTTAETWQYLSYVLLGADQTDLADEEVRMGRVPPSRTAQQLIDLASDDLYFVAIICSSKPADGSKPEVLWSTRAACTCVGTSASEAIPFLISELRPHLGKDTGRPMIRSYSGTEWAQLTKPGPQNTALAMSPKN